MEGLEPGISRERPAHSQAAAYANAQSAIRCGAHENTGCWKGGGAVDQQTRTRACVPICAGAGPPRMMHWNSYACINTVNNNMLEYNEYNDIYIEIQ
mmetsp:Transcript_3345/g.9570  ORF Transcript_3345/g.9570 Transcript_3345/m.9570 type:complete len:97 (+) Transcript_3345:145-435(+)